MNLQVAHPLIQVSTAVGIPGPIGPQGPQGPQGVKGDTGEVSNASLAVAQINFNKSRFRPSDYSNTLYPTDYAKLNAAVTEANTYAGTNGSGVVEIHSPLTLANSTPYLVNPGFRLVGMSDNAMIRPSASMAANKTLVYLFGTGLTGSTFTVTAQPAADSLTLDAVTGLAVGDYMLLQNMSSDGQVWRSQIARIFSIVSLTVKFEDKIRFPFNVGASWSIKSARKIVLAKDIVVEGLKFDAEGVTLAGRVDGLVIGNILRPRVQNIRTGYLNTGASQAFNAFQCFDGLFDDIRDCRSGGSGSFALSILDCSDYTARDLHTKRPVGFGIGYTRGSGQRVTDSSAIRGDGRGIKFQGVSGCQASRITANYNAATYIGIGINSGAYDFTGDQFTALYNGYAGLWVNGADDQYITIDNIVAHGNTGFDISVGGAVGWNDNEIRLKNVDNRAVVNVHSSTTNCTMIAAQRSRVGAAQTSGQALTSGSNNVIIFSDEKYDVNGEYNPATGIWTAKRECDVTVETIVAFSSGTTTATLLGYVAHNSTLGFSATTQTIMHLQGDDTRQVAMSGVIHVKPNDTIRVIINPGTALTTDNTRTILRITEL